MKSVNPTNVIKKKKGKNNKLLISEMKKETSLKTNSIIKGLIKGHY